MLVIGLLFYIIISLSFVAFIVFIAYLIQPKGAVGERRVSKLLESLGEEAMIFNDLYIPKKDGEMTQVDHVLLSAYGLFVIETKNYKGWIFGGETQRNWTQTIYKKRSRFYNPVMQNNTHLKALQHHLNMDVPVHSIIVFSDAATFKFKEPFQTAHVIQTKHLKRTIEQYKTQEISAEQLIRISKLLNALIPKTKQQKNEIKKQHLEHVKEIVNSKKKKVNAVKTEPITIDRVVMEPASSTSVDTCPKCGSNLVLRNGKYGSFYGCNGFPKCRYTRNHDFNLNRSHL
ncbi:NERD domain-containing protein [Solibacillus sp. FSL W8-0474]|uniref:NERD domain-containing protein n=1 Tax=Solibacillus sp. FSL W8-0474 TaxID=2975336 RepID=UPI0030FC98B8